ncbi:hypothetical protein DAPPUDRAFT_305847 [Daphnia pulex]|uniref:Dynactin subunit 4 n=1 Tax=Daphnia pulex TaxID=6669 RepID=E9GT10_DAPPU|nr:hypothetical protein DAPPUDRAFT_305847 [Daphnia pulex]|eukprot:EFX77288.1 hypothetical protein DAPPUDRAFT_305847 [Daphnia pulex]
MTHLFKSEKVQYLCTCGSLKPLCRTFFCRHCLALKCGDCVFHEVDILYCSNCLENVPPGEARVKKNQCSECFECPVCDQLLLTRATNIQVPSTEDPSKLVPKKMFYLVCGFCRWTTREAGLPDQPSATGSWPDSDNANSARVAALLEHYRSLAQLDKFEKEQKRQLKRRSNYLSFTADKYSLSALAARKRSGLPFSGSLGMKKETPQIYKVESAVAFEETDDMLDPEIFTKVLNLSFVTTIDQRIRQSERQPVKSEDLIPIHKFLSVRRSQRCRFCEHNLSKPEYNPSSIKFKIHLGAFYHVPDVIIFRNSRDDMQLRLCNRSQYPTHVRLLSLDQFSSIAHSKIEELESSFGEAEKEKKSSSSMVGHELCESPATQAANFRSCLTNALKEKVNAFFQLPSEQILLPARDDLAEYELTAPQNLKDDPKAVLWRKGNKVVVSTPLTVLDDELEEKRAGFVFEFGAVRAGFETKEVQPQPTNVYIPVFISLGKI